MARSLTRMSLSMLALASGLTALSAGSAKAQFYRYEDGYGPPVYRGYGYGYDRYDDQRQGMLRPRQVMRILLEQGYRPVGQILRNGDVFVVNVIDPDGMQQRVVVDAYQGEVLQTHDVTQPTPPADIPGAPAVGDNVEEQRPRMATPVPGPTNNNGEERQQRLAVPAPRTANAEPPVGPLPSTGASKPRLSEKEEVAKSVLSPIVPMKPPIKPMPAPKPIAPKPPAGEAKAKPSVESPAPAVAATPPVVAPQPAPTPAPIAAPAPTKVEKPTPPAQAVEAPPAAAPAPAAAPVAAAAPPRPVAAPAPSPAPAKPEPPKPAPGPLTDVPVAPLE
jgi:hypothetical protein